MALIIFLLPTLAMFYFLAFIKLVVNITPTESDNKVFGYLDVLINMLIADRIKNNPNNE